MPRDEVKIALSKLYGKFLPSIRRTGTYSIPKLEKNPKYRTRMIGTAAWDIRSTVAELQKIFGVKSGIALTKATNIIERAYGVDMEEVKELIPLVAHETGYLNATEIGGGSVSAHAVRICFSRMRGFK